MIIQARGSTALLITQPDHAALAGRIMARWKERDFDGHPRRASILLAIREHDNGWDEVDAAPILDRATGLMVDFVDVPAEVRRAIWPRAVERLSRADGWAAALVAQHAVHVYRRYRGDREWDRFFTQLEASRDEHRQQAGSGAGLTFDHLMADYFFVRMGDLLSLTFCNAWKEAPDEFGYTIHGSNERLTVTPDPFGGSEIPMDVRARELPHRAFASDSEAAEAFASARVLSYRGVVRGVN
jgi:hypothetical protein